MRLQQAFQEHCRKNQLFKKATTIIVGVSGGKDSVTLLHLMVKLRQVLGLKLIVAHFDHRLRPASKHDAAFVSSLAGSYHLPVTLGCSGQRAQKGSIEQNARLERFAFFSEQAKLHKADAVALAHSRDDLAETVLMRLIRGGGTKGLAAITPKRLIKDTLFIRPLLFVSSQEILQYVKANKLTFRTDATNKQKKFFRNLIRLELLPLLEKKYNPNIKEILAQTADNAATDYDYLLQRARHHYSTLRTSRSASVITLKLQPLKKLHPAMQRLIVRLAIEELVGSTRRLTFKHWQQLTDLLFERPPSTLVDLPKNVRAKKDINSIKLYITKA